MKTILSWIFALLVALAILFYFKTEVGWFRTVSGNSMEPNLEAGERLFTLFQKGNFGYEDILVFIDPISARSGYDSPSIKRVIGLPGDTIELMKGQLYLNGQLKDSKIELKRTFLIKATSILDKNQLLDLGEHQGGLVDAKGFLYSIALDSSQLKTVESWTNIERVEKASWDRGVVSKRQKTWPNDIDFPWNWENLGPIYLPKKGDRVKLTSSNLYLHNLESEKALSEIRDRLNTKGAEIFFESKNDYYFLMGDNRPYSVDSRQYGLVADTLIQGKISRR